MDRGIPTEQTLEAMREGDTPVRYLVGTPKGRLTRLEKSFLEIPWQEVRQSVDVKLLNEGRSLNSGDSAWASFDDNRTVATAHAQARRGEERRWPSLVPR